MSDGPRRPDDDRLRRWLAEAGPRPGPGEERQERVRQAVRKAWLRSVDTRRRRRRAVTAALAATALIAVGIGSLAVLHLRGERRGEPIGRIVRVLGLVQCVPAGGTAGVTPLSPGARVWAGDTLETATGGAAAIAFADGASLRVSPRSRVVLSGRTRVRLDVGELYADSGEGAAARRFVVETGIGTIEDIGTRFLVQVSSRKLGVFVRDGRVLVRAPTAPEIRLEGKRFVELERDGRLVRGSVPPTGRLWKWAERVAPPFQLEGKSFEEFILWVARETGHEVSWADERVHAAARNTVMHGELGGVTPRQALEVVPATGFDVHLEDGILRVSRRE